MDRRGGTLGPGRAPRARQQASRHWGPVDCSGGLWSIREGGSSTRPTSEGSTGLSVPVIELKEKSGDPHVPAAEVRQWLFAEHVAEGRVVVNRIGAAKGL